MYSLNNYIFNLPEELIAYYPSEKRDAARLMKVDVKSGSIEHRVFRDIIEYFNPGDLLLLNDTRVIKARFFVRRKSTGGRIEILLIEKIDDMQWKVLCNRGRKVKAGERAVILNPHNYLKGKKKKVWDEGELISSGKLVGERKNNRADREERDSSAGNIDLGLPELKFIERQSNHWIVRFDAPPDTEKYGSIPLPPYIKRKSEKFDEEYYQTVYSDQPGSVAAPTAGLHFTDNMLRDLSDKGVRIVFLTLHVSYGTFAPVRSVDIREHKMHSEFYNVPPDTAEIYNEAKLKGNRIFVTGTTSLRVVQSIKDDKGLIKSCSGSTDIFIYPPYDDFSPDGLITNFHTPGSTLLMLISAFGGYDLIQTAYLKAVEKRYRFFSYGDAMLILR